MAVTSLFIDMADNTSLLTSQFHKWQLGTQGIHRDLLTSVISHRDFWVGKIRLGTGLPLVHLLSLPNRPGVGEGWSSVPWKRSLAGSQPGHQQGTGDVTCEAPFTVCPASFRDGLVSSPVPRAVSHQLRGLDVPLPHWEADFSPNPQTHGLQKLTWVEIRKQIFKAHCTWLTVSSFMVMGLVSGLSLASHSDSRVLPSGARLVQPRWIPERRILGGGRTRGDSFWPFPSSSSWWWLISYVFLTRTSCCKTALANDYDGAWPGRAVSVSP